MSIVENYIKYVSEVIEKYSKSAKLIHQDQVSPADLNRALASFLEINLVLLSQYQAIKIEKFQVENEYSKWYDEHFSLVRKKLFGENESNTKVSLKELEVELRYVFKEKYYGWQEKIAEAEAKERFLLRIIDLYKGYDSILTCLSNNMRSELRSLSLQDRMNNNPEKVKTNRVRIEFPNGKE